MKAVVDEFLPRDVISQRSRASALREKCLDEVAQMMLCTCDVLASM